jgi:hypothetical protein
MKDKLVPVPKHHSIKAYGRMQEFWDCLLSFSPKSFVSSFITKNLKIKMYKTVILPVSLYGCGTWSLALREGHRLSVFEKSVEEDIWT